MTSNFHLMSRAVKRRFDDMSEGELFTVEATDLWESYLAAYPEGTNPIFRVRTEHDCSCCRSFVRQVGHVVQLTPDGVRGVWDRLGDLPHPYDVVADRMSEIVRQLPVTGVWRTKQTRHGTEVNRELLDGGDVLTWSHFYCDTVAKHRSETPEADRGQVGTNVGVFRRGMDGITLDAIGTVLELIDSGQLYRGAEVRPQVADFLRLRTEYHRLSSVSEKENFVWLNAKSRVATLRNTSIGTLLVDLSEGRDVEEAVRAYEHIVAPQNYRRTTAVISQKQVDAALEKLRKLGLESAVHRRHASARDVSVRDVLFVDSATQPAMKDGLAYLMSGAARRPATANLRDAAEIGIEEFLRDVVPTSRSLSALVEGRHAPNFVSLTAPQDPEAPPLFRWGNGFGWSYDGDVTDSVRERVKRAGGRVDVPLRVSLGWYNKDDLDVHANDPSGHVYFGSPRNVLDVDMNVRDPVRDAVENLSWTAPRDGPYRVWVNQYNRRESVDVGFEIEMLWNGETRSWRCERAVHGNVECFEFGLRNGEMTGLKVGPDLIEGATRSSEKWGVSTGAETPVRMLVYSPNHWGEGRDGARHTIFVLDRCLNPEPVRGVYTEYLRPDLSEHRRVLEVLGSRTKAPPSPDQLSGVGFTGGRGDSIRIRSVGESHDRVYSVKF